MFMGWLSRSWEKDSRFKKNGAITARLRFVSAVVILPISLDNYLSACNFDSFPEFTRGQSSTQNGKECISIYLSLTLLTRANGRNE